jgi:hypothetical protein
MPILEQIAAALQTGTPGDALGISAAGTVEPVTAASSGPSPSSSTPASIGAPAVGVSLDYARADHAHGGALTDLSDVASTAPTTGQVLTFGGSQWAPATPAAGTIAGTIDSQQIAVGTGIDSIAGDPRLNWTSTTATLSVVNAGESVEVIPGRITITTSTPDAITVTSAFDGVFWSLSSTLYQATWIDPLNPSSNAVVGPDTLAIGDGVQSGVVTAGTLSATHNATGNTIRASITGGQATITSEDSTAAGQPLNLEILDLRVNGAPGAAGEVLTSNGAGAAPTWQPATGGGGGVDVQTFTATGAHVWAKPAGASAVEIIAIGGGGGGGGGQLRAASNVRAGGTGGGGGAISRVLLPASLLAASESLTVGNGGTGGAAQTVSTGLGADGNPGAASSFGSWLQAGGGGGGKGANGTNNIDPGTAGAGLFAGSIGGDTSTTAGTVGGTGGGGGGGGGGGTSPAGSTTSNGGAGGAGPNWIASIAGGAGGIAPGGDGANGTSTAAGSPLPGAGGGGGASSASGPGANGGNGGDYGGGGGGGGGGTTTASGAGGDGASGIVVVISYL